MTEILFHTMQPRHIIIDGKNFDDLASFFVETNNVLTRDLDFQPGDNLNAFNDLLYGGFGVHDYEEPIKITWTSYSKSKKDLGNDLIEMITGLIEDKDHIELQVSA